MFKRFFDFFVSGVAILLLVPFFLLIAISIKLDSKGPVFFRQERVGRFGSNFRIHKFRTMKTAPDGSGSQITAGNDPRITRVGFFLRKYKLDELAQLLDVFLGHMSLVGPRPEVPAYVDFYNEHERKIILSVRPGITDRASIEFKDENAMLGRAADPHYAYIHHVMPIKIRYYIEYVQNQSFLGDIRIILSTLRAVFF